MMKTLVAGGAGFIGSHLCDSLLSDGHYVICLDNLGSGRSTNVERFRDNEDFSFVEADAREDLGLVLSDHEVDPSSVDRIYHLASRASPKDFEKHSLDIAETNSRGTRSVLEFARQFECRVLYTSTSEVYGDPTVHPQSESYFGNVNPRGARACYDESKRFGEMLTSIYHRKFDVDVRTARPFNTYGPRMRPDDGRVVSNFLTQALVGTDLTVYGEGSQTRSFLYVSDQVRGLRTIMDAPEISGMVINIGSKDEITIRELAERVIEVTDSESEITLDPLPHEDDPERRQPDISRAKTILDWEPTTSLEEGLRRTASHFMEHEL